MTAVLSKSPGRIAAAALFGATSAPQTAPNLALVMPTTDFMAALLASLQHAADRRCTARRSALFTGELGSRHGV